MVTNDVVRAVCNPGWLAPVGSLCRHRHCITFLFATISCIFILCSVNVPPVRVPKLRVCINCFTSLVGGLPDFLSCGTSDGSCSRVTMSSSKHAVSEAHSSVFCFNRRAAVAFAAHFNRHELPATPLHKFVARWRGFLAYEWPKIKLTTCL